MERINQKNENIDLGLTTSLYEVSQQTITSNELTLTIIRGCKSPQQGRQSLPFILHHAAGFKYNGSQIIVPIGTQTLNLDA